MEKRDLKTGMLTEDRDGNFGLVINGLIIYKDGFNLIDHLSHSMTCVGDPKYDIIRVSIVLHDGWLSPGCWDENTMKRFLLWEREPEKTYTIDGVEYSEKTLRNLIKKVHELEG